MTSMNAYAATGNASFGNAGDGGQVADHSYLDRAEARIKQCRLRCFGRLWLQPCALVLCAGSGMGDVAVMLGGLVGPEGRAVGVDRSAHVVDRARARATDVANVEYRVGDLASVPFDSGTFDAAYSEGNFVHLDDPDAAMRELHRVLRPGGRLVIVDSDHSQSAIDADDDELAELLDRGMANDRSGRRLRSQAVLAGFADIEVEAEARVITDRAEYEATASGPIADRLEDLVADGIIDRDRAERFLADQDTRATEGRFQVTVVSYVVAAARRVGARAAGR